MVKSKSWNWEENENDIWLKPSEISYYLANKWKDEKYKELLDFGCGLGRHSIFFAKNNFNVSAFDLSQVAIDNLNNWADKEKVYIETNVLDMLNLKYDDNSFDCIFAYHVISHTDSVGIVKIISEIKRILRPNGEVFLTLCSKDTWSFKEANFPKLDESTVLKTEHGTEFNVPHFYVNTEDILKLLAGFEIQNIRHIDDCYFDDKIQNSKHYFIIAKNKP